jgi:hypothetical protein
MSIAKTFPGVPPAPPKHSSARPKGKLARDLEGALKRSSIAGMLPEMRLLAGKWDIVDAQGQSHLQLDVRTRSFLGSVEFQQRSWPDFVREGSLQMTRVRADLFVVVWHWPSLNRTYVLQETAGQEPKATWKELGGTGEWTWKRPLPWTARPTAAGKGPRYARNQAQLWTFGHPESIWRH